jgi:hypothetical protein
MLVPVNLLNVDFSIVSGPLPDALINFTVLETSALQSLYVTALDDKAVPPAVGQLVNGPAHSPKPPRRTTNSKHTIQMN